MILKVRKSSPTGTVKIPGSKSHTIRALYFASLADGVSQIIDPLDSADTQSAITVCKAMGAKIENKELDLAVHGFGCEPHPPAETIDVGNSGTSLRIGVAVAGLGKETISFTGDRQIRSRPMAPLIHALHNLGVSVHSLNYNDMAPLSIKGPIKGGSIELNAVTSQFLTALLIACPLCQKDTEIIVTKLNEIPYVEMTLWWLDKLGIKYENRNHMECFLIPGNQSYRSFTQAIPADFSSATFFMAQAAISGQEFFLENLDMSDPQGDKAVVEYLRKMGAIVKIKKNGVLIKGGLLNGRELDLNATPDALPAMAVVGCFAQGETVLLNVPQARLKETDRIHVMCTELKKMGADIKELSDALIIRKSKLQAASLSGHADHRIIMALSVAGMNVHGETTINTAEAVKVTFPDYFELMEKCGAKFGYVR